MINKIRTYSAEISPAAFKNAAKKENTEKADENKKNIGAKAADLNKTNTNQNIFEAFEGADDNAEASHKAEKASALSKNLSYGFDDLSKKTAQNIDNLGKKLTRDFDGLGRKTAHNFAAIDSGFVVNCLLKLFINAAVWFFVFMLLLAAVIYAAAQTPQKTFLGYSCYAIADECFEPQYSAGECIITGRINAAEIEVNDFITFIDDDEYIAGIVDSTIDRYKNVNAKFFRVKDAYNNTYVVEPKDITGKEVCRLSGWGYIVNLLGSGTLYS